MLRATPPPGGEPAKAGAGGAHGGGKAAGAAPDAPFLTSMTSAVSAPVSPRVAVLADPPVAGEDGQPRLARISSCNRKLAFHRQLMADEDGGTGRSGSADLDESDDDGDRELDAGQRHLRFVRASSLLEDVFGRRSSASTPSPAVATAGPVEAEGSAGADAATGVADAPPPLAEAPAAPLPSGEGDPPALTRKASNHLAALTRRPSRLGPRTQQVLAALHLGGRSPKAGRRDEGARKSSSLTPATPTPTSSGSGPAGGTLRSSVEEVGQGLLRKASSGRTAAAGRRDEVTRRSTALIPATPATTASGSAAASGSLRPSVEEAGQELLRKASGGRTKVLLVSAAAALRRMPSRRRTTADGGASTAAAAAAPTRGTARERATDHSPTGSVSLAGSSGRLTVDSASSGSLHYSAWAPSTDASSRSSLLFDEDADERPCAARRARSHRPSRFEMLSATSSPRYSYSWQDSDTESDVDAPFVRRRNTAEGRAGAVHAAGAASAAAAVGGSGGGTGGTAAAVADDGAARGLVAARNGKAAGAAAATAGAGARAGAGAAGGAAAAAAEAVGGGGGSVAARLQLWESRK